MATNEIKYLDEIFLDEYLFDSEMSKELQEKLYGFQGCLVTFSVNLLTSPEHLKGLRQAVEERKPLYILRQKNFHLANSLLVGADVRAIVEYDGQTGSPSYYEAKDKLTDMARKRRFDA